MDCRTQSNQLDVPRLRSILCIVIIILLVSAAALASFSVSAGQSTPNIRIGIDTGHGNLHTSFGELQDFTSIVSGGGGSVLYSATSLNQTFLNSVDLFLVSAPTTNYSKAELTTLANWIINGGRIWLSGSSENVTGVTGLNLILQNLNSSLRLENSYAADPIFNLNSASNDSLDLLAPILNHNQAAANLGQDLRVLYAYAPIPILGYEAPSYVKLNPTKEVSATIIGATSSTTQIYNLSTTLPPHVYSPNTRTSVPIVAVETLGKTRLALTGYPVYSSWKNEISYLQQRPYDNRLLVRNLLRWLTNIPVTWEIELVYPLTGAVGQILVSIDNVTDPQHFSNAEIKPFQDFLTGIGINSKVFTSYAPSFVGDANAIIVQAPHRIANPDERAQIVNWFAKGNRTLILESVADFALDENATESEGLNNILLDLHSNLRFEQAALYDPGVNLAGAAYFALSSNINHNTPSALNFTRNVRTIFFQFSTILDGFNQTQPIPLESNLSLPAFKNVTWISRTSNASFIEHLSTTYPLLAHKNGDTGSFITAAVETLGKNRIILLGGPIFTASNALLRYPTISNYPIDNLLFIRNLFTSLLPHTQIKTQIKSSAYPNELREDETARFSLLYSALYSSVSNLSYSETRPITPANTTLTLNGVTSNLTHLSNGSYTTTISPTATGKLSWSVAASAKSYQNQTSSGSIQVDPVPVQFGPYVLSIPILLFIAVTIYVTYRKAR